MELEIKESCSSSACPPTIIKSATAEIAHSYIYASIPMREPKTQDGLDAKEVLRDLVEGATLGEFSGSGSEAKLIGQYTAGLLPVYGQICDVRDTAAAVIKVWRREPGAWRDLGVALLGWLPAVGDMFRGKIRGVSRGGL
jgi:hypothetical protein